MNNIFVSTGGYKNKKAIETAIELSKSGIKDFELSGGVYDENLEKNLQDLSSRLNLQIHNYFPPPKDSFVFNLASLKEDVFLRSSQHVKTAIEITSSLKKKFFSFHAGFLIDPNPEELGQRIKRRTLQNRDLSLNLFIKRVNELGEYAEAFGVKLLVENNVSSANNFQEFGEDAFLFTEPGEAKILHSSLHSNVGILLDVAHLKVSAKTLNFQESDFIKACNERILAYHLSDNQGLSDSNDIVEDNSWFWKYLRKDAYFYTLEIYNVDADVLKNQIKLVNQKIGN